MAYIKPNAVVYPEIGFRFVQEFDDFASTTNITDTIAHYHIYNDLIDFEGVARRYSEFRFELFSKEFHIGWK